MNKPRPAGRLPAAHGCHAGYGRRVADERPSTTGMRVFDGPRLADRPRFAEEWVR